MTDQNQKKDTRQRLLDSAAILFSDRGYACTSVAEICKRAEANIASVNYHFGSKEGLYRSVIQYTHAQAEALYPFKDGNNIPVQERFYQFVLVLLQRILSTEMTGNYCKLMTKEMAEPTDESGPLVSQIISDKRAKVEALIKEVYSQPADDELIFRMSHSIISQCLFLGLTEKGRRHHLKRRPVGLEDAVSFARHITDFSLAGLRCYGGVKSK
ncbi:MAG: CerR family C-terminal domain-containing protein [Proteobacteria bacterium]|nr:helix-turn-helix transcriptional regulator [Desulfobulbaceae bacterium]MBU4152648.1 CerR family C-terminal domain-containing protein [Pseudomonadota bacterium]MDP2104655.1 CerR family C-terminal domain-containing protein [Desulfobulbaceae bacterium]